MRNRRLLETLGIAFTIGAAACGGRSPQPSEANPRGTGPERPSSETTPSEPLADEAVSPPIRGSLGAAAANREAAAKRRSDAMQAAAAAGVNVAAAIATPGGTPNYFGPEPNYANSPLPVVDPVTKQPVPGTGIRKFVDTLPGLGSANANNLGQYIPIATPMTPPAGVPADGDYYELGVVDYTQRMHSDLPATTQVRGYVDLNPAADGGNLPHYLGPIIVAARNRPVRVKFTNMLGTGAAGNLFLPVDTTIMGAGTGPNMGTELYTQNRATLHLHGGDNPWISDGTPHQWTVPAGETTSYPKGYSTENVPDMPDPGPGALTFYYPNQQSSRMMFYHDHSYGITRLNVYAGEAAGYLVTDQVEEDLIAGTNVSGGNPAAIPVLPDLGGVYHWGVPLIVQDKTFVPDPVALAAQDPTWNWGPMGNLWFPHVYMTNQNPADPMGSNAVGRWDYGPWFWPPQDPATLTGQPFPCPTTVFPNQVCPGTPNPTIVPEAFMDTPVVNGTAYPTMSVGRKAYRFRILNASNDRTLNLQLYYAVTPTYLPGTYDPATGTLTAAQGVCNAPGMTGCTEVGMVPAVPHAATPATNQPPSQIALPLCNPAAVPPVTTNCWPTTWPTDGRDGGVPDPLTAGPPIIQIGNEGGLLPGPAVLPNNPVNYEYNRRSITVLNVSNKTLMLGPAERADVIVDFSQVPDGATLIMYNDAPAPIPAFDTRYDYYTGDVDQTTTGGAPTTLPGYGPNTRTIMQIQVSSALGTGSAFNLAALQSAMTTAYPAAQQAPLVPQSAYSANYGTTLPDTYARIQDQSLTYTPIGSTTVTTTTMLRKAIQELFDLDYGRMNATLGVELPLTNFLTQTTIPYGYIDPPTEMFQPGEVQIWKITHNGVDTHSIHFHLFNVQLINRVGWDGMIKPPDPNELGLKETVRMNPLEDVIVALQPKAQANLPWALPNSIRPLDPTSPIGSTMGFTNVAPDNTPSPVTNQLVNFGNEYVWHCHLLGHEENDMMRPMLLATPPAAPSALSAAAATGPAVNLTWTSAALNATGFVLQRALDPGFTTGVVSIPAGTPTYSDTTVSANGTTYYYQVMAVNTVGSTLPNYTNMTVNSPPSTYVVAGPPDAPSGLAATQPGTAPNGPVALAWTDNAPSLPNPPNATTETGFTVQRSARATGPWLTLAFMGAHAGTGAMTYTDRSTQRRRTYYYRVLARNLLGNSPSNVATITTR